MQASTWIAAILGYIVAAAVLVVLFGKVIRAGRGMTPAEQEEYQRQEDAAQAAYLDEFSNDSRK